MNDEWQPANDTEQALARAAAEDRRDEFFRILTTAELYLPQFAEGNTEGRTFITAEAFGHTVLPVYTSVAALTAQAAGVADAYTTTSYAELREKWPRPDWRLAVNPGLPIDAYLPVEAVEVAARGELPAVTAAGTWPDAALRAAAARGDADGYVDALLDSVVLVPTGREVTGQEWELFGPGFPWRLAAGRTTPTVQVFTSEDLFSRAYREPVPHATVPFAFLVGGWPEGHGLSVNSGSDLDVELPPDQMELLRSWVAVERPLPEGS